MRYFFFSYIGNPSNAVGNVWMTSSGFPAYASVVAKAVEVTPALIKESVIILHWHEMNETDYKSFISLT